MADAEETLRKLLDEILDEMNYKPRETEIKAIESGGANITSVLFFVNVSSPNREDLKIFAKVACVEEKMRSRMIGDWLYDTERFVYTKLLKVYNDIENKMNVSDEHKFRFPKLYGYNAEKGRETVVMENLVESGYQPFSRFESLDWAHASAAIENLAKFHALSFAYAKHHPDEFQKLIVDLKFRIVSGGQDDNSKDLWQKPIACLLAAVEQDLQGRIIKVMKGCADDSTKYSRPIGQPVIVHGDYKCSNILFRKQGVIVDAVSIDYQTVYSGTPVCDIIYFIVSSTDEEFRKQYFDELLAHYYTKLEEALKRLSVLPYSVILGAIVLPLITAEGDSIPKVVGDVKDFIPTPNALSVQRFRGIVNDCVKWGAI
ncbi:uncharacterized protein LOC123661455 [Melitaea cinxia]|uniref:uncharacterized protein LOC123661455 n=1 Tax=Melitaea cinxia TaxID=113334 RepID=UPI001E271BA2|nr:uncharacterized protein LOC123661455 [Melitaea cinxia]